MARRRGFFAELAHQAAVAEKNRQRAQAQGAELAVPHAVAVSASAAVTPARARRRPRVKRTAAGRVESVVTVVLRGFGC
jgi:hypothetical protein